MWENQQESLLRLFAITKALKKETFNPIFHNIQKSADYVMETVGGKAETQEEVLEAPPSNNTTSAARKLVVNQDSAKGARPVTAAHGPIHHGDDDVELSHMVSKSDSVTANLSAFALGVNETLSLPFAKRFLCLVFLLCSDL